MTLAEEHTVIEWMKHPKTKEKGFALLVQLTHERMYAHIGRMLYRHADIDDVLQDVYVKVFQKWDTYRGKARLYTWLYRITANECLDFIRRQKHHRLAIVTQDEWMTPAQQPKADAFIDDKYVQQELSKAIANLPDRQKLVFNLRYFDEMPYAEMSKVLDTSQGSLKASYHHAIKKIERHMKALSVF